MNSPDVRSSAARDVGICVHGFNIENLVFVCQISMFSPRCSPCNSSRVNP
jgi:hypothetical protein